MQKKSFILKYAKTLTIAVSLLLWLVDISVRPVDAGCGEWQGTKSIKESQKHGLFLGRVSVTPSSFEIDGKKIEIQEAWLEQCLIRPGNWKEKSDCYFLCLTVLVDGNRETGALGSSSCLDFVPVSRHSYARCIDRITSRTLLQALSSRPGYRVGYIRHVIYVSPRNLPNEIKTRASFTPFKVNAVMVSSEEWTREHGMTSEDRKPASMIDGIDTIFHLPHLN